MDSRMTRLSSSALALILLGALVAVVHNLSGTAARQSLLQTAPELSVYARTECGAVKGTIDEKTSLSVYRGIPYATVPGRFQPPVGISKNQETCWKDGVLDASRFGPICMQERSPQLFTMDVAMSEDCLSLNVWTPKQARPDNGGMLPVLVFIHGGGLTMGHSSWQSFVPWTLAQTDQVIVVSLNYRLGALGWLAVDTPSSPAKGNFGLLDCIEALRWVRRNIEAFGGDFRKVSIVGQSSGGTLVHALTASPLARGLFSRAVSMSGSPQLQHTAAQASEIQTKMLVGRTSCAVPEETEEAGPKGHSGPKGHECGEEGGKCECIGRVHYGIKGKYSWHESFGEIECNNDVFGDPVVGSLKRCYCEEAIECAKEGGVCECLGRVQYGDQGVFEFRESAGSIACTNQEFGDPLVGVVKECYCLPGAPVQNQEEGEGGQEGEDPEGLRDCLLSLDAEELVQAGAVFDDKSNDFKLPGEDGTEQQPMPWLVIDGYSQLADFETGMMHTRVPMVFGEMREEAAVMPAMQFPPDATEADAARYIAGTLAKVIGDQDYLAERILQLYPRPQPPQELYLEVTSDIRMFCPLLRLARSTASASPDAVYMYQMAYRLQYPLMFPGLPVIDWAFHSLDLLLLAHRHGTFPLTKLTVPDLRAKILLQSALMHFAWTGTIPSWYAVGFTNEYIVNRIGDGRADPRVHSFRAYGEDKCDLWNSFAALGQYAVIN